MTFLHKHPGLHMKVKVGDMVSITGGIRIFIEKLPTCGGAAAILTVQAPLDLEVLRIPSEDQPWDSDL